jgi:hypothetical protein
MNPKFKITREDGRSNARVLLDHFAKGEAGQTYEYAELLALLSEGVDHVYKRADLQRIVVGLQPALLREQQRAIHNVRLVGYRLAPAREHQRLALERKRKSDTQMARGFQILRDVRWDELGEQERKAHEGTLLLVSEMMGQMHALERRQSAVEQAIRRLGIKPKEGKQS